MRSGLHAYKRLMEYIVGTTLPGFELERSLLFFNLPTLDRPPPEQPPPSSSVRDSEVSEPGNQQQQQHGIYCLIYSYAYILCIYR